LGAALRHVGFLETLICACRWTEESVKRGDKMKMANAIKPGRSEEVRLKKKTSKVFGMPGSTLKNKVNIKETNIEKMINNRLGRKPVLPYNLEEELVSYCRMLELKFFGLTTRSIKRIVFDLAIKMIFSAHYYCNNEEQPGSGCVNLCAATLD
jgi:hypothetical protein